MSMRVTRCDICSKEYQTTMASDTCLYCMDKTGKKVKIWWQ